MASAEVKKPSGQQSTGAPAPTGQASNKPIAILVIGPRGSGKSLFIGMAKKNSDGPQSDPPTTNVYKSSAWIGSQEFVLIDTPGFDNTILSDCDIFLKILEYLGSSSVKNTPQKRLNGVIYVQHSGDSLRSRTLERNLRTLKILLGEQYLHKVTVLMRGPRTEADNAVRSRLVRNQSAFCELQAAKFRSFPPNAQVVREFLLTYTSSKLEFFNAQIELASGGIKDIRNFVENTLGYTENPSVARQLEKLQASQAGCEEERHRLTKELYTSNEKAKSLQSELEKTEKEYASLRSHLQVQENITTGDINLALVDLNRSIEDLARTISDYLVDAYPSANTTTTTKAFELSALKNMFVHVEGMSSLAQSSTGAGMSTPYFLDYAIRSIICEHFYHHIFEPFHPSIAEPNTQTDFMRSMYKRIQYQEAQAVAGRWRANAFKSISENLKPLEIDKRKAWITERIMDDSLNPLLRNSFGNSPKARLQQSHLAKLNVLVTMAWDWNQRLKGSVVLLGDFQPFTYPYGHLFDSRGMTEPELKSGEKNPDRVLSTIGFGTRCIKARGEGREPEETLISKAIVISEKVFQLK